MPYGWEGNRRSCVAMAMHHRHKWFSTYGLKAWKREMSTPYALLWSMVDFTFTITLLMMSETRFLGLLHLQNLFFCNVFSVEYL